MTDGNTDGTLDIGDYANSILDFNALNHIFDTLTITKHVQYISNNFDRIIRK